jgi:hypothetical protein
VFDQAWSALGGDGTSTLSGFGLDRDIHVLSTNEVRRRLKEFFSARIANPNPKYLIYSGRELGLVYPFEVNAPLDGLFDAISRPSR